MTNPPIRLAAKRKSLPVGNPELNQLILDLAGLYDKLEHKEDAARLRQEADSKRK